METWRLLQTLIAVGLLTLIGCAESDNYDEGAVASDEGVPDTIIECEQRAADEQAELAFEPRRQMTVGRTYEVRAVLALGEIPSDVTFEVPTTVVVAEARCEVEAELTGGDFTITPAGPQSQSFVGTRSLRWQWDVRPNHSGEDLVLTLRLQATVVESGRSLPGPAILNESLITVDAAPRSLWRRLDDWSRHVFGHPAIPLVGLPMIVGVVAWIRRRLRGSYQPRHYRGS